MYTQRTPNIVSVLLTLVIALGIAVSAQAESAAELLEKGIYTEQTIGDLTAAIEIYSQVVEDAAANRPHIAQAQLRLGMCYLKIDDTAKARETLGTLIQEFPEQERLVAQARELLTTAKPALALDPVPWKDGEFLQYDIKLPTGKVLGRLYQMAESAVVDGVDAWKLEQRKFFFSASDSFGVSRVWVDRHTQRPIHSTFRNGVIGAANAVYGPDGAEITGGETDLHIDSDQEIYDNEQGTHLMRMLPLALGYKTRISFLPTWTGTVIDVGLEVTGIESCQVPVGTFDCFVVGLDVGQTLWISTGPERRVVKLEAGGAIIELSKIGQAQSETLKPFGLKDFGFSSTLPGGWLSHEQRSPERASRATLRLLDPEAMTLSAIEADRCPRGKCPSLQQTSERELEGARRRIEGYTLREDSWNERVVEGRSIISFVGDYQRNGEPWVQYRLYTFVNQVRLETIFRTPKEHFEELRADFDSIVDNIGPE